MERCVGLLEREDPDEGWSSLRMRSSASRDLKVRSTWPFPLVAIPTFVRAHYWTTKPSHAAVRPSTSQRTVYVPAVSPGARGVGYRNSNQLAEKSHVA